ncbi:Hypothetical protein CAP_7136 [Chondromyces apiculatus DSM 436]|uniref:Uncharacterized protein n=1 Tax=Chondromyces apiculatus DSM 436 TaxID=1192034 RepID=A0A017T0H6_9BACT|nr:Hypothetical protein CAP_7136 [Chondromyces apiculatus DSM 436]
MRHRRPLELPGGGHSARQRHDRRSRYHSPATQHRLSRAGHLACHLGVPSPLAAAGMVLVYRALHAPRPCPRAR